MPRRRRFHSAGYVYHVLNRAAGRRRIFSTESDYAAFEKTLEEARGGTSMRLLAYCIMPNHWHLVLWPQHDEDLSNYMQWLTFTHTQRYHLIPRDSASAPPGTPPMNRRPDRPTTLPIFRNGSSQ